MYEYNIIFLKRKTIVRLDKLCVCTLGAYYIPSHYNIILL